MNFEELNGKKFNFYGASEHQFKLNSTVWEALEAEDDGYRSYLRSIERKASDAIFFRRPIARVMVVVENDETYKLVDVKDGHEWLRFGTEHSDTYYPWFYFTYQPKEPNV